MVNNGVIEGWESWQITEGIKGGVWNTEREDWRR